MTTAAIILAAGQGTRMKSSLPKVLHRVASLPLLGHVIAALRDAGVERIVVVSAPDFEAVRAFAAAQGCESVVQDRPLGTGHAALAARAVLGDFGGTLVVASGDTPLLTGAVIGEVLAAKARTGLGLLAFTPAKAGAYGRVLRDADGNLDRIIEFKDADAGERAVTLCNAGLYAAEAKPFFQWAAKLGNANAQGEYYLTDVPALARRDGVACAIGLADETAVMGVNSRAELAEAEAAMQKRLRARALANGVGMTAPETVFFSHDTRIEADAQIGPYVVFGPGVHVASGVEIKAFSHIEGAQVAKDAVVGPYARLRPGARIGEGAHIGNFVEVKNTVVEKGAKANHLTYLGDARVGEGANIGAGTITCNYDGFDKTHTDIGAGAFIGSNSALIAPVKIGDGAITGAGSVIAKDVSADALALTRAEQKEVAGWAKGFRAHKTAKKGKGK
jgi:bifunctional UDP-N-acetylglucosamine pyrophosphorylase/glucosamine-1-phosphate N-acetyltransferase